MTGLVSMLPHIITVGLLWLAVIVIAHIFKRGIFKSMDTLQDSEEEKQQNNEQKERVGKVVRIINISATVIALSVIVLIVLFLSNPMERTYREIKTTTEAAVDEDFVEPTKEEIIFSNKEVIEKKHRAKEEEAEWDNIEAMQKASDIFRKAVEETGKK
ncbi:MAG: hypothetical protein KAK00_11075 [Nanoarchaeota archaeon]|nr:hypothetical protein [Nanoarchaeota archaeon]